MLDQCVTAVHSLLLDNLPLRKKRTPSGWISFNCPMCSDKRGRGGIRIGGSKISYHCFNCPFRTGWTPTPFIGKRFITLAERMGAQPQQIQDTQLLLLQHRDELEGTDIETYAYLPQKIPTMEMPDDAVNILDIPEHPIAEYARERGVYGKYPLFQLQEIEYKNRLVIPFFFNEEVVGWTGRHISKDQKLRYLINMPQRGDYIFNVDRFIDPDREIAILVEGVIDAILLDCMGLIGSEISEGQLALMKKLSQRIIVCPDLDSPGSKLMDQALELGLEVSIPTWHRSVDDPAKACSQYGRLATAASIINNATTSSTTAQVAMNLALQDRS